MITTASAISPDEAASPKTACGTPLAQLLHALNQPLTGLQCSMEVALAAPRTAEQYVRGLRDGLELTGRMRLLVAAIREVMDSDVDFEGGQMGGLEIAELDRLLRSAIRDFEPVAEVNGVGIELDGSSLDRASPPHALLDRSSAESGAVKLTEPQMAAIFFRLLDSILSVAARGTWLRIATECQPHWMGVSFEWQEYRASDESASEVGLLVAQARLERAGAQWERHRKEGLETLMVRLPGARAISSQGGGALPLEVPPVVEVQSLGILR